MPDSLFGIETFLLWRNARRTQSQLGQSYLPSTKKSQSHGTHRICGGTNATAGQTSIWTNHVKHEAEAPFTAIQLKIHGRDAAASNGWKAVVAPTSTAQVNNSSQLFRPTPDGVTFSTALAGPSNPDGWRNVTWSGAASVNLPAGSSFLPSESPWSDWIPCRSVSRSDGGVRPLSMLRVFHDGTVNPFSGPSGTFSTTQWNSPTTSALDYWRLYQSGISTSDAVATLTTEPASLAGSGFWLSIRYNYAVPRVRTVVVVADSIGESNGTQLPGNNFGCYALRACSRASTPDKPICFVNAGVSGQTSSIYLTAGLLACNSADVTDVVYHAGSPNDGATDKFLASEMLSRTFQMIQYCQQNRLNLFLCTMVPDETHTATNNSERLNYNNSIRNLASQGFGTLVDIDAAVSANTTPLGTFKPSMRFDAKHPNDVGMDAEANLLRDALLATW